MKQNKKSVHDLLASQEIKLISVSELKPYKRNAKKHPKEQIRGLAESIRRFGFTQPVVVDSKLNIIIGHGRVEAAKLVPLDRVPCLMARSDLTSAEIKALRLIDNRIAETGWDTNLLSLELKDLNFDFAPFAIDFNDLNFSSDCEGSDKEDEVPELPEEAKTRPGDVWKLGKHRLVCGDATNVTDVEKLFAGVEPGLMITDPPYGVSYDPTWRSTACQGKGMRSGGKVQNDDKADWTEAFALFPGDVAYVWHAGLYAGIVGNSLEACGFSLRTQIIWAKQHFAIGRGNYHWQHEPCWYAVKKSKKGNWCGDRKQTTLWQIANRNAFGGEKEDASTFHGTQKPVECMRRPITNHTNPGQAVYDPFLGSGTTLIAAEQTGRVCYSLELDPKYCDVIIKRWEKFTGKKAELEKQS